MDRPAKLGTIVWRSELTGRASNDCPAHSPQDGLSASSLRWGCFTLRRRVNQKLFLFPAIHWLKFRGFFCPKPDGPFTVRGLIFLFRTCLFKTSGSKSMMNKFTIAATEERWRQQAEAVKQEAETLPFGRRREALVSEARRLRTASQIDQWLSSSELQPPT
jgi:hypothetical protein